MSSLTSLLLIYVIIDYTSNCAQLERFVDLLWYYSNKDTDPFPSFFFIFLSFALLQMIWQIFQKQLLIVFFIHFSIFIPWMLKQGWYCSRRHYDIHLFARYFSICQTMPQGNELYDLRPKLASNFIRNRIFFFCSISSAYEEYVLTITLNKHLGQRT